MSRTPTPAPGPPTGVRALVGVIIECDPAAKQIIKKIHDENPLNEKFIVSDLDETHLFVKGDMGLLQDVQRKLDQILEQNTYRIADNSR
ncbi:hypothetical protein SmJEL517_g02869 [Synchytrium microbalum]|uniref:General transcription and DNA repair factor IIH subunit TFB5 n=1 Tax=Synchytrium microbalum TaxID=1806994 RepID=A0A507BZ06_9FUNG|nr:uncharacterized protein SmJEL517_g02869 [Synchytrium microbalum]TPX34500.1 hypothetical protein SmJEL517_g02869 [Synchytrium microbalum]